MTDSIWDHVRPPETRSFRLGALGALAILSWTYLYVLYEATIIVATPWRFLAVVVVAVGAAIVLAGSMSSRGATQLTIIVSAIAFAAYFHMVPGGWALVTSGTSILGDFYVLATGTTILSIVAVDLWVLAFAPGPVFLSWYLALESRYSASAWIGMLPVILLILTGDLTFEFALAAVVAAVAIVGCGELAWMRASLTEVDLLAIVIACMLVASLAITVVPATGTSLPTMDEPTEQERTSTEDAFVTTDGALSITGNPSLSPEVRYTIEADSAANWRVDAYDRYTGDGWVQTGEDQAFNDVPIVEETDEIDLEVRTETTGIMRMPAQYEPRVVDGVPDVYQTPEYGLRSEGQIDEGETYRVISQETNVSQEALHNSGWEYDDALTERYTQLPADTPDRVEVFTSELTANASSPYETAVIIEQYLIQSNDYSLDVPPPEGDVADAQIFERDVGYCVYFATTMAAMLRTQDIPARMVTGYSSGEQVDDNRWVVRGMNAHAWVEVYIPDVGWVEFDPTPSGPYDDVRTEILEDARDAGEPDIDTAESGQDWTPQGDNETETEMSEEEIELYCDDPEAVMRGNISTGDALTVCSSDQLEEMQGIGANASMPAHMERDLAYHEWAAQMAGESTPQEAPDEDEGMLPPAEWMGIGLGLLIGGVASMRRIGVGRKLHYAVAVQWQGSMGDASATAIRAWDRLELYLAKKYEPRQDNESVRAYLSRLENRFVLDERIYHVADAYEHARYRQDGISERAARDAVDTVDQVVNSPLGRLRR